VKRRIEQLRALSLHEWWLMITAMVLLPLVALSLWVVGFKRIKAIMSRFIAADVNLVAADKSEMEMARTISRMVAIAARHGLYRANCLKQSIVIWWLLMRQGIYSEICIGIDKDPGNKFKAHAWVECGGINLSESEGVQQKFAAFDMKETEVSGLHIET
jgi:hypothetical protein